MTKFGAFSLGVLAASAVAYCLAKLSNVAEIHVVLKGSAEPVDAPEYDEEDLPAEPVMIAESVETKAQIAPAQAINYALRDAFLLTTYLHDHISEQVHAAEKAEPFDAEVFEAVAEADQLAHGMLAAIQSGHLSARIPVKDGQLAPFSGITLFQQFRDMHLTQCHPTKEARDVFWNAAKWAIETAQQNLKLNQLAHASFTDAPRL